MRIMNESVRWVGFVAFGMAVFTMRGQQPHAVQHERAHVSVQVLAINDLHGNLEPPAGRGGMMGSVPAGGAEYLATHLSKAALDNPNSILVGAGDLFGASPLLSSMSQDQPTIEALNAMHMSVTSIGNHELDHGPDEFLRRIKDSKFQYLAANVERVGEAKKALLPSTAVRVVGGVKIGFIGETLEGTPDVLIASSAKQLRFHEETAIANAAAARMERQGVHTIVLLLHQGGMQHPEGGAAVDPNGCDHLSSDFVSLVEKLSPTINVVISAHTHQAYRCEIAGHTVTSAASYGRMYTRLILGIDPRTDKVISVTAHNEVVTRDVAKDPAQTAILERYRPAVKKAAERVVGSISGDIHGAPPGAGESPLGDVIADAQLASVAAPDKGGAVIAFMNTGGIRAEILKAPNDKGVREVTFGDLYAVQPFGNQVTVRTMNGELLERLLEQQFKASGGSDLLQVSDGFSYQYRKNAEPGHHVVPGSMTLHGKPIAATDKLRVEASDFLMGGGDGMTVLREGTEPVMGPVDVDALIEYFGAHSPVAPGPGNRIVRVD